MEAIGIGPSLALRGWRTVLPAFDFAGGVLPPGATLTRASPGMRYGAGGVLVSEAANVARFDHDPVTLVRRGLLIEAAATNLQPWSEQIDNAAGWSHTGASVTADAAIAPDGGTTAELLTTTSAAGRLFGASGVGVSGGQQYTASLFLKRGSNDWQRFQVTDGSGVTIVARAWINLATGAIGNVDTSGGSFSVGTATVAVLPNGWLRVSLPFTAAAATTALLHTISSNANGTTSAAATGTSWYVWGAQLEAGTPSSYIASGASAAARAADVLTLDWASRGVADGAVIVRYTFDDGSTQDVAGVVSGGGSVVPTGLARPWLLRAAMI